MKLLTAFFLLILVCSCGIENDSEDESSSDSDTILTPAERFSLSLTQEILDEEDEDLQKYLEEEFFTLASNSPKVTIDKVSSSLYIFSFQSDTVMKNFLLQKFYVPVNEEFVFEKSEIDFDAVEKLVSD